MGDGDSEGELRDIEYQVRGGNEPITRGKRGARFRIRRFGVDSICKSSIGEFWALQAQIRLILGWFLVFCVF